MGGILRGMISPFRLSDLSHAILLIAVDRHYWRCGFCGFASSTATTGAVGLEDRRGSSAGGSSLALGVISGGTASSGQHSLAEKLHDERLGRSTDGEKRTTQEFVGSFVEGIDHIENDSSPAIRELWGFSGVGRNGGMLLCIGGGSLGTRSRCHCLSPF